MVLWARGGKSLSPLPHPFPLPLHPLGTRPPGADKVPHPSPLPHLRYQNFPMAISGPSAKWHLLLLNLFRPPVFHSSRTSPPPLPHLGPPQVLNFPTATN